MITSKPDGTLKFHKHEAAREKIVENMDQWTTKIILKTVSTRRTTRSSHTRDTAGGGRCAFSKAYDDVPMSILQQRHQQRHTINTHKNDENFLHHQRDQNHNNAKE